MKNNQVATEVIKIRWLDAYIFVCHNVVTGNYDEEQGIFTDIYGEEYCNMMSGDALTTDAKVVYNIMDMDKLKKLDVNKNKKVNDIISEYYKEVATKAYVIGYTDEYTPYVYAIKLDFLKEEANRIESNGSKNVINPKSTEKLEQLILDTIDGKYTKEQLKEMIEVLETTKDTIDNTIGTMETKISAIDSNMSFKDYLNEQIEKEKNITKPATSTNTITDIALKVANDRKKEEEKKKNPLKDQTIKRKELKYDIEEIYNKVKETLIAQDEPLKKVITEIVRKDMDPRLKRQGIFITGATGTGKTEMMRQLAMQLNKKLIIVDSSQLTIEGYVGKDIEKELYDLYEACNKNIEKTEEAIVFFDEIDKKGTEKHDDPNGRGVLNLLLKFIEGTTYDAAPNNKSTTIVPINTSNMTVIFGGAFTDVYNHSMTSNIGFSTEPQSNKKYHVPELEDFEKYGMMPREFLGRVLHVPLNPLGLNDLKRILLESKESAIKIHEKLFRELGVHIIFTDQFINKVAEKAYLSKTGARGLNDTVNVATSEAYAKVYMDCYKNLNSYKEVLLTDKTVEDSSNYQLVNRRIIRNKNKK